MCRSEWTLLESLDVDFASLSLLALADLAEERGDLEEAKAWRTIQEKEWKPAGFSFSTTGGVHSWRTDGDGFQGRGYSFALPDTLFDLLDSFLEGTTTPNVEGRYIWRDYSSRQKAYRALLEATKKELRCSRK